jgi:uncharacterized protein YukE
VPDAASPSWNQIIDRVSILSNYLMLKESAQRWDAAVEEMEKVRTRLLGLAVQSADKWRGEGGAAFQEHVRGLAGAMDKIKSQHQGIAAGLRQVAEHLRKAVMTIPIPSWRYAEVEAKQAAYARYGVPPFLEPAALYRFGNWIAPETNRQVEEWFNSWWNVALAAYRQLESAYRQDALALPQGTQVPVPGVRDPGRGPGTAGPRTGTTKPNALNSGPGAGLPPGGLQTPTSPAGLTQPSLASSQLPGVSTTTPPDLSGITNPSGVGNLPGVDTLPGIPDPAKAGLAGIGTLGGGGGIGGGGLGGGLGGGGLGGGGLGGLPGLGPAAELPASVAAGFAAPGSLGARGLDAAGGGRPGGAGTGGAGMYPPMAQTGGQGNQAGSTDTMLHEDEVKAMFGFETDRSAEPEPDIPKGGVLEA